MTPGTKPAGLLATSPVRLRIAQDFRNRKLANLESEGHVVAMLGRLKQRVTDPLSRLRAAISERLRPKGVVAGAVVDLLRTNEVLRSENALLRQQLRVASRRVKKPTLRISTSR